MIKKHLYNLIELFALYENAYDDDLEWRESEFLEEFIELKGLLEEEFAEERPHLFGLKES